MKSHMRNCTRLKIANCNASQKKILRSTSKETSLNAPFILHIKRSDASKNNLPPSVTDAFVPEQQGCGGVLDNPLHIFSMEIHNPELGAGAKEACPNPHHKNSF